MKTYKHLYDKICTYDNLYKAYKKARKGKCHYKEVQEFEKDIEGNLSRLQGSLLNGTYRTSEYTKFTKIENGKERTIYKLPFYPDRICQWAIMLVISPIFISKFTTDTYSAIPGRGTHQALRRLQKILYDDPEGTKYCLKLDVRHYYLCINHEILKDQLARIFRDLKLLDLLYEIIDSISTFDIGDSCIYDTMDHIDEGVLSRYVYGRMDETSRDRYDRYLSSGVGIPIGNYTSQYFGNLYLTEFDRWIKQDTNIKYYFRYMDDLVILYTDKSYLAQLRVLIDDYINSSLRLSLKDNWQIYPVSIRGIDFLGYRFFGFYTLLRKRNCIKFKSKMRYLLRAVLSMRLTYSLLCAYQSYKGLLIYCDSYRLSAIYYMSVALALANCYNIR